jgi:glycolate oxidase FAD binding subunit
VTGAAAARGPFVFDGCELRERLAPQNAAELADALRTAGARGGALLVRGGGSRLACGNPLRGADALLSTERLARVVELDADEGVVCAEAGVPLAALREAVGPTGWELPLDPPGLASTVGGALAAAAPGPRFPQPRDALLGVEVALADGSVARSGGRVVKNVTGYDLPKLFTGSFGSLGVIASAWLRLRPRPERCSVLAAPLGEAVAERSLEAARRPTARAALAIDAPLAAALDPTFPHGPVLLVELAGDAGAVERDARWLADALGAAPAPAGALERARELLGGATPHGVALADVLVRVAVVATRAATAAEALRAAGADVVAQPARGLVHARLALAEDDASATSAGDGAASGRAAALVEAARAAAAAGSGTLRVEAAPLALRRRLDVFGDPGPRLALLRRLKAAFDPGGLLNPGRFAGGL